MLAFMLTPVAHRSQGAKPLLHYTAPAKNAARALREGSALRVLISWPTMALGEDPAKVSAEAISGWLSRRFTVPDGFHISSARPSVTAQRELVLAVTIAPTDHPLGRFNLSQAEELRGELGYKPNGRRLKRTKRACAARGKALAKGGGKTPRTVIAKRLSTLCPPLGTRKHNGHHATATAPQVGDKVAILKVQGMPYGIESYYRSGLYRYGTVQPGVTRRIDRMTLYPVKLRDDTLVYVPAESMRTLSSLSEMHRMMFDVLANRIEEHLANGGSVSYLNDSVHFSQLPPQQARKRNDGFGWSTGIVKGKKVIVTENGKPLLRYAVVDRRGKRLAPIYATTDAHARKQLTKRTPKARLVSKSHLLATSAHGRSLLRQGGKSAPRKSSAR